MTSPLNIRTHCQQDMGLLTPLAAESVVSSPLSSHATGKLAMEFTLLHIFKPVYHFGIISQLSPACQSLFWAIVNEFNSAFFPPNVSIESQRLSELANISYSNLSRTRKQLLDFKYEGESLLFCRAKQREVPVYALNTEFFISLFERMKAEPKKNGFDRELNKFVIEQEKEEI